VVLEELRQPGTPVRPSELARRAGVSPPIIDATVHNRQRRVSLHTPDAGCNALGVDPGDLLERT
jgi:DNA-binding Xre family transcriptional regulator